MLTQKEISKLEKITSYYLNGNDLELRKGLKALSKLELTQLLCCQHELRMGIYANHAQVIQFQDYILNHI